MTREWACGVFCGGSTGRVPGKNCQVVGFGRSVTAIEVGRQ